MDLNIDVLKVGDIKTNCYIVYTTTGDAFVVDPGGEAKKILDALSGIKNLNLRYILLTHAHYDHVLALDEIKKAYPKADIIIGQHDVRLLNELVFQGAYTHQLLMPIESEVVAHRDGDELNFSNLRIKVIETPGHTEGSVCYLVGNKLFSGDTLFYHTCGRVDLPHSDPKRMRESLNMLFKLPAETIVYPGHGQMTTIKEEISHSQAYIELL